MDRIRIGKVLKPQGLKGELKIGCDSPNDYLGLSKLFIMGREYKIRSFRSNGEYLYVCLEGIDKLEDTELFRGQNVFALKEEIHLNDGQYFIDDLIGCVVIDDAGIEYGVIKSIENYGSKDVYTIEDGNGKQHLFACIDGVIESVDICKKIMVVNANVLRSVFV